MLVSALFSKDLFGVKETFFGGGDKDAYEHRRDDGDDRRGGHGGRHDSPDGNDGRGGQDGHGGQGRRVDVDINTRGGNTDVVVSKDLAKAAGYMIAILLVIFVVEVCLSIWSAVLSFRANRLIGWGSPMSVVFAIFAFLFGLQYLLVHLFCKLDLLAALKKGLLPSPPMTMPQQQQMGGGARSKRRR